MAHREPFTCIYGLLERTRLRTRTHSQRKRRAGRVPEQSQGQGLLSPRSWGMPPSRHGHVFTVPEALRALLFRVFMEIVTQAWVTKPLATGDCPAPFPLPGGWTGPEIPTLHSHGWFSQLWNRCVAVPRSSFLSGCFAIVKNRSRVTHVIKKI